MKRKTVIPMTISGFTEYIHLAYRTAKENMSVYDIDPKELAKITPLFDRYASYASLCANPATATKANRDARNIAWKELERQWRIFLNREIRYNDAISLAGKEVFGIFPRDHTRTAAATPTATGTLAVLRTGEFQFDLIVEDAATGKRKRPSDASGSNLYSAVVEVGHPVPLRNTFRFEGFSSKCRHTVRFRDEQLVKRAYFFVRYTNSHGQEGPDGPMTSIIIS